MESGCTMELILFILIIQIIMMVVTNGFVLVKQDSLQRNIMEIKESNGQDGFNGKEFISTFKPKYSILPNEQLIIASPLN